MTRTCIWNQLLCSSLDAVIVANPMHISKCPVEAACVQCQNALPDPDLSTTIGGGAVKLRMNPNASAVPFTKSKVGPYHSPSRVWWPLGL